MRMIVTGLNLIVTLTNAQNVDKIQQRSYVFMRIFIYSHRSYCDWHSTQSTFLKIFRCSRFPEFDRNIFNL